jgi:hypothetical protein
MPSQAFKIINGGIPKQNNPRRRRRDTVKIPEPVVESLRKIRNSRVKLVTLFNSIDLQKDYGRYSMVYDGRKFRKLVAWSQDTLEPTRDELKRFLIDIINAAKKDREIREFMKKNPFPFRRIRIE